MNEVKVLVEKAVKSSEILLRENDYETSISRSYYAMFYLAEALLTTFPFIDISEDNKSTGADLCIL